MSQFDQVYTYACKQLIRPYIHSLRNPLNAISLHADLLAETLEEYEPGDDPPRIDALERPAGAVRSGTQALTQLLDGLSMVFAADDNTEARSNLSEVLGSCVALITAACERVQKTLEIKPAAASTTVALPAEVLRWSLLALSCAPDQAHDGPLTIDADLSDQSCCRLSIRGVQAPPAGTGQALSQLLTGHDAKWSKETESSVLLVLPVVET